LATSYGTTKLDYLAARGASEIRNRAPLQRCRKCFALIRLQALDFEI